MGIANSAFSLPSDYWGYDLNYKGSHVEAKAVRDKKSQNCSYFGKGKAIMHGHVKRSACHVTVKSKPYTLVINLRRCKRRKCDRTYFEPLSIIMQANSHVMNDIEAQVIGPVRLYYSFAKITRSRSASADIVQKVIDMAPLPKRHLLRRLCVGEFHNFSQREANEEGTKRYQTMFTDGSDEWLVDVGQTQNFSIKNVRILMVNTYRTERTNAHTENVNMKIKDVM